MYSTTPTLTIPSHFDTRYCPIYKILIWMESWDHLKSNDCITFFVYWLLQIMFYVQLTVFVVLYTLYSSWHGSVLFFNTIKYGMRCKIVLAFLSKSKINKINIKDSFEDKPFYQKFLNSKRMYMQFFARQSELYSKSYHRSQPIAPNSEISL